MKKIKILTILFLACLFAALCAPAARAAAPGISSRSALVLDRKTGETLWAYNASERLAPADSVKLMTALLAAEAIETGQVSPSEQITAGELSVAASGGSTVLMQGEVLELDDLLALILLSSDDGACLAVAQDLAGSVAEFVNKMNARAQELGCENTNFTDPHGLGADGQYSTAADMARIALEAAGHPILMQLCAKAQQEIPATNLSALRTLQNTNPLLNENSIYGARWRYERATGMKTGWSGTGGGCLISTADDADSGISLLCAVFGGTHSGEDYTHFTDTVAILDWVYANYSYQEVLDPAVSIASVDVRLGRDSDYVNLRPATAVTLLLPNGYDPNQFDFDMQVYSIEHGETVTAPVTAGEVLGEVSVMRDGQNFGTVKLVAASTVDLSRGQYISSHVQETVRTPAFRWLFWSIVFLLVLYIAWVILYRVQRRKYLKAVKAAAAETDSGSQDDSRALPQEPKAELPGEQPVAAAERLPAEAPGPVADGEQAEKAPERAPLAAAPAVPEQNVHSAPQPQPTPEESEARLLSIVREFTEPEPPAEDPQEAAMRAERDYFKEFFRQK